MISLAANIAIATAIATATVAAAEAPGLPTLIVRATYRLEHSKTSGTAFLLRRPAASEGDGSELLLVTAAHVLEQMEGGPTQLVTRVQDSDGEWKAAPMELAIRRGDQPLWHRRPQHDVAVLKLAAGDAASLDSLPVDILASAEDWNAATPQPGATVRCVGFPHAAQFKPSAAAFPLTRLGCVASFPLLPFEKHPTFLVDYNTFEGDSGGPVYLEMTRDGRSSVKVIGLVHAQHFLDERYKTVYQEGLVRKRLGLAITVNSQAILQTILTLP